MVSRRYLLSDNALYSWDEVEPGRELAKHAWLTRDFVPVEWRESRICPYTHHGCCQTDATLYPFCTHLSCSRMTSGHSGRLR